VAKKQAVEPKAPAPLKEGDIELLEAELREAIRVEPTTLEEEFVRTGADLAWWSAKSARALGAHLRATARRKRLHGLLYIRARQELEEIAEDATLVRVLDDEPLKGRKPKPPRERRPPTEGMVEARLEGYPEWEQAVEDEIAAEVERERLKGAVVALLARKDMVVQLGATARAEMEREPMIRDLRRIERERQRG
jgi:hypothetical protein